MPEKVTYMFSTSRSLPMWGLNVGKDFDFQSYINIYGINEDDTGTLQTNGFYIDGKMTPFVSWTDDYHTKYSLYHGKILGDIFKAIFTIGISYDEIVKVVEERDMWYNS